MGLYFGLALLLLAMGLGCEVFWSKFRSQNPDLGIWNRFGLVVAPSFQSLKKGFSAKNLIPLLGFIFGGLAVGVLWVFFVLLWDSQGYTMVIYNCHAMLI